MEKIQISKWIMMLHVCDAAEGIVAIKKRKRKGEKNGKQNEWKREKGLRVH